MSDTTATDASAILSDTSSAAAPGADAPPSPSQPGAAADASPTDAAGEAPKPPDVSAEQAAARFAALARKEREIQLAAQQAKKEREEADAIRKAYEEAKANPLKLLEAAGWDYNKLTDFVLNDMKPTQGMRDDEVSQKLAELERKQAEWETKQLEAQKASAEAAYKRTIAGYMSEHPESCEVLTAWAEVEGHVPADIVYETVEAHYNETGRVLSVEEAVTHLEGALLEKKRKEAQRLLSLKAFEELRAPQGAAPVSGATKTLPGSQASAGPTTLTNQLAASQPPKEKRKGLPPREESLEAAARLLLAQD